MRNFVIVFEHTEYVYENQNQAQIEAFMGICELNTSLAEGAEYLYLLSASQSGDSVMALVVDGSAADKLEFYPKHEAHKQELYDGITFVYEAETPRKDVFKQYKDEKTGYESTEVFAVRIYRGENGEKVLIEAHGNWAMMRRLADLADAG
ncbi:MAG: hypothetical protein IJU78_08460 [Clostridia bacterium]|nr:hypothetical protein [Clostridia bacterium]